jgi:hypothetical protein
MEYSRRHNNEGSRQIFYSWLSLYLCSAIVIMTRLQFAVDDFADFYGYVVLLDVMTFERRSLWDYGDPLSWGILAFFRILMGDSYRAIELGNIYISAIYIFFSYVLVKRYAVSWHSIVLIFVTFGPILAFVTIRATPAYFLVLFACLEMNRGSKLALPLCLLAALFHSSALLALPAFLVGLAQARFSTWDRLLRSRKIAMVIGLIFVLPFALFRNDVGDLALTIIETFGSGFSRFVVYVQDSEGGSLQREVSIFQQIYFILASLALLALILLIVDSPRGATGYFITSYALFVLMSGNPPSAFRQSLYWMMPLMVVFPWSSIRLRGLGNCAILVVAVVVYWFSFSEVIV